MRLIVLQAPSRARRPVGRRFWRISALFPPPEKLPDVHPVPTNHVPVSVDLHDDFHYLLTQFSLDNNLPYVDRQSVAKQLFRSCGVHSGLFAPSGPDLHCWRGVAAPAGAQRLQQEVREMVATVRSNSRTVVLPPYVFLQRCHELRTNAPAEYSQALLLPSLRQRFYGFNFSLPLLPDSTNHYRCIIMARPGLEHRMEGPIHWLREYIASFNMKMATVMVPRAAFRHIKNNRKWKEEVEVLYGVVLDSPPQARALASVPLLVIGPSNTATSAAAAHIRQWIRGYTSNATTVPITVLQELLLQAHPPEIENVYIDFQEELVADTPERHLRVAARDGAVETAADRVTAAIAHMMDECVVETIPTAARDRFRVTMFPWVARLMRLLGIRTCAYLRFTGQVVIGDPDRSKTAFAREYLLRAVQAAAAGTTILVPATELGDLEYLEWRNRFRAEHQVVLHMQRYPLTPTGHVRLHMVEQNGGTVPEAAVAMVQNQMVEKPVTTHQVPLPLYMILWRIGFHRDLIQDGKLLRKFDNYSSSKDFHRWKRQLATQPGWFKELKQPNSTLPTLSYVASHSMFATLLERVIHSLVHMRLPAPFVEWMAATGKTPTRLAGDLGPVYGGTPFRDWFVGTKQTETEIRELLAEWKQHYAGVEWGSTGHVYVDTAGSTTAATDLSEW